MSERPKIPRRLVSGVRPDRTVNSMLTLELDRLRAENEMLREDNKQLMAATEIFREAFRQTMRRKEAVVSE